MAQNTLAFDEFPWQQPLPPAALSHVEEATESIEARGAIFTRPEVVEFILDLAGYTVDKSLHEQRFLEPSIGRGDFLLPAIARLLTAWRAHAPAISVASLKDAIRGVELDQDTFAITRQQVIAQLTVAGIALTDATLLADHWLIAGDFLLAELPSRFHFVIGNPPYVRQERIPAARMAAYRARFRTIYDRADLYVPFIERSLQLLESGGHLGFICADRWMKNRYGGPLRALVAKHFHLKIYVDMVNTPAFQSDVIAYPAITIIAREPGGETRIAHRPDIDRQALAELATRLTLKALPALVEDVQIVEGVAVGAEPWVLDPSDQLALVRRLEANFPTLEEAGCKVGIGVATGADKAFIASYDAMDVEDDRKLPLATTKDIASGEVRWRGLGVLNPFADDGGLVDLEHYPRLRQYLEVRKAAIAGRHVARKTPASWYRTIDRITPPLAVRPKLLIPDIKGDAHIVYEPGRLYPHHNLYYIVSDAWDLRVLQAVLRSGIARLFVAAYSTHMHGGFLRFQAQYLRRIRVPHWHEVPAAVRQMLTAAGERNDPELCHQAVVMLYGLSEAEREVLGISSC